MKEIKKEEWGQSTTNTQFMMKAVKYAVIIGGITLCVLYVLYLFGVITYYQLFH